MSVTRRQFLHATIAAAVGASWTLPACASQVGGSQGTAEPQSLQSSFFCFDTACVVGGVMGQDVLDAVVERCQGFEQALSRTIPTSDVGRINAAGGAPVEVASETAELITLALDYCQASDGLFDITIGAVSSLWDFKQGIVPTDEQIEAALLHVGYERVEVSGRTVILADPQARIDLGGIAKGYVADVLVEQLEDAGVTSGYVNLGGNVKVLGAKPDGSPWRVGVRDPQPGASESDSIARVTLAGGSVVTSGLYERRFERDGKSYWHILDPRTGYPAQSDLVSATIVSDLSIDGDGYTKPLFMMGAERALSWAAGQSGLQVLLVGSDGAIDMAPQGAFELLG
ncbi:MAG: FAD:protein FMN transferase [Atopobiaceae bacterium]|nr:FAD:protein FMN transferase [Atopobiaceae bacterium]